MTPLVVVGDVHGNAAALRAMLGRIKELDRRTVFVGDYVNGGPDSRAVLDVLCACKTKREKDWVFLAGNHDLALLDYLAGGSFAAFAAIGGVTTIASYVSRVHSDVRTAFNTAFPKEHRAFLTELLPCYEEDDVLISHVGFSPNYPLDRSLEILARNGTASVFSSATPRNLVVCGHYTQMTGKPYDSDHLICIDTGCGVAQGPLTAVLLPERVFYQIQPSELK